jgi:hypothetical protein
MSFLWFSGRAVIVSPYGNNQMVFVMEVLLVFCEVGAEFLNV